MAKREEKPELLDLGAGSEQDVRTNLAEMDRINRWLGGDVALFQHLIPRLKQFSHQKPIHILDLGTGSAGIPTRIIQWAEKHQRAVTIIALDWASRNLTVAQAAAPRYRGQVHLLQADAAHLPIQSGQVDFVISSLFMHHIRPEILTRILRDAYERSHCGLIMSDLVRGRGRSLLPITAFLLSSPIFARHYLTRHDGILSIRRAYTPEELGEIAAAAGLPEARIHRHFPWRMTLVVDK